jgi:hypothetical protein
MTNFEEKTKNQGTSKPEASNEKVNGDMAWEWEELVELDDVQLATIVGGDIDDGDYGWDIDIRKKTPSRDIHSSWWGYRWEREKEERERLWEVV